MTTESKIYNYFLINRLFKSKNKKIISTNIETREEREYISMKTAAIELDISVGNISNICKKRKSFKTAKSKKDGHKYSFKYLD